MKISPIDIQQQQFKTRPLGYEKIGDDQFLELLAEDRRLREFFRNNRLLMLPLEQEVEFLRQAADEPLGLERQVAVGVPVKHVTRHVLGLFSGQPGARRWRRQHCSLSSC